MITILAKTKNSWKKTLSLEPRGGVPEMMWWWWQSVNRGQASQAHLERSSWTASDRPERFESFYWRLKRFPWGASDEVSWFYWVGSTPRFGHAWEANKANDWFEGYGLWPLFVWPMKFCPLSFLPFLSPLFFFCLCLSLSLLSLSLSLSRSSFVCAGSIVLQTAAIAVSTRRCSNFTKPYKRLITAFFFLSFLFFCIVFLLWKERKGNEDSVTASFCDYTSGFCGVLTTVWVLWRFFRLFFPSLW